MDTQSFNSCPRCGEGKLQSWRELDDEERMLARRLPGTVDYSANERERMHRWCTLCWFEETTSVRHEA